MTRVHHPRWLLALLVLVFIVLFPANSRAQVCTSDVQCQDASFCNGHETCDPRNRAADARGCLAAYSTACAVEEGFVCDEASRSCSGGPVDADHDGEASIGTGGLDCDDNDPQRAPGHPEICDADGVDEDCNTETPGHRDADGDGHDDVACVNYIER